MIGLFKARRTEPRARPSGLPIAAIVAFELLVFGGGALLVVWGMGRIVTEALRVTFMGLLG